MVGVMEQLATGLSIQDGHVQGIDDQFGHRPFPHGSTHHPAGEGAEDGGQAQPPVVGGGWVTSATQRRLGVSALKTRGTLSGTTGQWGSR